MKVLNVELNFDFSDADDLERFEKEYPETEKRLQEIKWDNAKASETIRSFCKVIFEFFDKVFGEGTADKVFKGKSNYQTCLKAFKDVVDEKDKQDNEVDETIHYLENYSPDRAKRD